jgi:hypothetical protein
MIDGGRDSVGIVEEKRLAELKDFSVPLPAAGKQVLWTFLRYEIIPRDPSRVADEPALWIVERYRHAAFEQTVRRSSK